MKKWYFILIIIISNQNFALCQSITEGLVAFYPFNSNTNDIAGNNHNATNNGATLIPDRFGDINKAYSFDGINDFMTANWALLTGNSPRTISLWFKTAEPTGSQYMLSWGEADPNKACGIGTFDNLIEPKYFGFSSFDNDIFVTNPVELYNNAWHHIAFTYDGSVMNLFIDGLLRATKQVSTPLNTSNSNLLFGRWIHPTFPSYYNGGLDEVRIYNRALSSEEIEQIHFIESPTSTPIIAGKNTICPSETLVLSATGCLGTLKWNDGSTTSSIAISSAGTYYAICTINGSPSHPAFKIINTQNPIITSNSTNLCESNNASLALTGIIKGTPIKWYRNGNLIEGANDTILIANQAGSYHATTFESNGEGSKWIWQNNKPTGNALNSIHFINNQIGWTVGDLGSIYKTTDGGVNWQVILLDSMTNFNGVFFKDLHNGWIVGDKGVIFHTTDGGINWYKQYSNTSIRLNKTFFITAISGWIVGENGTVLYTNNSGNTWQVQSSGTLATLKSIHFINTTTGWICGGNGTILYTNNAGLNWQTQSSATTILIEDIFFIDQQNGWAVGEQKILKTQDGGLNWSILDAPSSNGFPPKLNTIFFTDTQTGWAAGDVFNLIKTTDGGLTWTLQSPILPYIQDLSFTDNLNGWIINRYGEVLYTTNGGQTWSPRNIQTNSINDVHFIDKNTGFAAGEAFKVRKTTDGGNTWNVQTLLSASSNYLQGIYFSSPTVGWIVGSSQGAVLKTIDGGNSWIKQTYGAGQDILNTDVFFVNSQDGWIIGAEILRTNNGGDSWQASTNSLNIQKVYFTSSNIGYGIGNHSLYKTTDGGITWNIQFFNQNTFALNSLYFTNNSTGWLVGSDGKILFTSDGGTHWSFQNSLTTKNLNDIEFINSQIGWIVGDIGTILKTVNGGRTWVNERSNTINNLNNIDFVDFENGWIVGTSGTILKYSNTLLPHCQSNTINIFTNPASPLITITSPVCNGESINLSTTTVANSYLWTGPNSFSSTLQNTSISNTSTINSGSYNLTITDANGCTATASTIVEVVAAQTPVAYNQTICSGNSTKIEVVGCPIGMVKWYSTPISSVPFHTDILYNTPILNSLTKYYVTCDINLGCVSNRIEITVNTVTCSGSPSLQHQLSIGGTNRDIGNSIVKNHLNSGYLAGGITYSTDSHLPTKNGNSDMFVASLTKNFTKKWFKNFGGSLNDSLTKIVKLRDNKYLLLGMSETLNLSYQAIAIKIDSLGNEIWSKTYGNTDVDIIHNCIEDSDGNLIFVGHSFERRATHNTDYWVFKADNTGTLIWESKFGGNNFDKAFDVIELPDGTYQTMGETNSDDGTEIPPRNSFDSDIIFVRYSRIGTIIQMKVHEEPFNQFHRNFKLINNQYILAGHANTPTVPNTNDVFQVYRFDLNLNKIDQKEIDLVPNPDVVENVFGFEININGNYMIGGYTGKPSDTGYLNGFSVRILSISPNSLTENWRLTLGGSQDDAAYGMINSIDNGLIVIGETNSFNQNINHNFGGKDIWIAKLISLPPCMGINYAISSGDWNDPSNWSCNKVPMQYDDVVLNQGYQLKTSVLMGFVKCKNLQINQGAVFTIEPNFSASSIRN